MRPHGKARRASIVGLFERGATQPGGMQRRPNATGLVRRDTSRLEIAMAVKRVLTGGALLLSLQLTVIGQHERPMVAERAAAQIAEITKRLSSERLGQLPWSEWEAERDRATAEIRVAVTEFVESS